jgi:hypothetical protein
VGTLHPKISRQNSQISDSLGNEENINNGVLMSAVSAAEAVKLSNQAREIADLMKKDV